MIILWPEPEKNIIKVLVDKLTGREALLDF